MTDKKNVSSDTQQSFDLGPNVADDSLFHQTYQTQIFATFDNGIGAGISKGLKSADLIPFYLQDRKKLSYTGAVTASDATMTRLIYIDGQNATLVQRAANIYSKVGRNKGQQIFRHLGEREETVIDALKYIASRFPSKFGEYQGSASLKFSLGQVMNVLGKRYNKNEIMEALDVLHGSDTELRLQSDNKMTKPVKSALLPILITHETEGSADLFDENETLMCTFHPFISKDIASLNFRQINYERIKNRRSGLAKYIEKRLSYNYTQASQTFPYGPVLGSTILRGAGIAYSSDRDSDSNFRPLTKAFDELVMPDASILVDLTDAEIDSYILEKIEIEPIYTQSMARRTRITDYKYTMYPTEKFIQQQIEANIAANKDIARLKSAKELHINPADIEHIKLDEF